MRVGVIVVLVCASISAGLSACGSNSAHRKPAGGSQPQSNAPSTTSAADVQFNAARTFSRLLDEQGIESNAVTVRGDSPFSTYHRQAVARADACHKLVAAVQHESWPPNVAGLIDSYLAVERTLCEKADEFASALSFAEFLAISPAPEPLTQKAVDLQIEISDRLAS